MTHTTRNAVILLAVVLAAAGLFYLGRRSAQEPSDLAGRSEASSQYYCSMHPHIVSDKPGNCPICSMKLVPRGAEPISAVKEPESSVEGRAIVNIPPERLQVSGVRSEAVKVGPMRREIQTIGRVVVDERRIHQIHAKYEGYVERLYVNYTGALVKKGEPLLSIYSPELLATQQEYLLVYRAQEQLGNSSLPDVKQQGSAMLDAARRRLLLWDIKPSDIERLERTGEVRRALDLHSQFSGYVIQRMATQGERVTPADTLFEIADLTTVWALADVYESDLTAVHAGMTGTMTLSYFPGRSWKGTVSWLAPTVDETTRTVKARLEVDNSNLELRPEMFANVTLEAALGEGLIVPESAVIDANDRQIVFLDRGEGRFEPREVKLGPRVGSGFQVLSGLTDGDRVATSANFLLDSESSMKAAAPSASSGHRH